MDTHAELQADPPPTYVGISGKGGEYGYARHALAMLLAAAVGWLVFAAYRQPELILNLAGMRLC